MQGRTSETSRHAYLDAMGILVWFPNQVLPNALPARELTPEERGTDVRNTRSLLSGHPPNEPDTPSMGVSQIGASQAKNLLELGSNHHPDSTSESLAVSALEHNRAELQKTTSYSKFRLVTLAPNDHCLIVAEMPYTGLNQFSRFHQHLLSDILHALNLEMHSQQQIELNEFLWPLDNRGLMKHMSMDDHAAADAVCAYLSNQFGLTRRRVVLLFGLAAARFVMDINKQFEDLRGIQPGLHANQCFAVTFGLGQLMKIPTLKSEAWHDLSPLVNRLSD